MDQELDNKAIVDFIEKDLKFTGNYNIDINNDGDNPTLLSVADEMLSDVSDRDIGLHHDKR